MREVDITADELVAAVLASSSSDSPAILDSCGVGSHGGGRLITARRPSEIVEIADSHSAVYDLFDELKNRNQAAIFTIAYELGCDGVSRGTALELGEPLVYCAFFDGVTLHDYETGKSFAAGSIDIDPERDAKPDISAAAAMKATSNFTRSEYIDAVETIRERIRDGDTYQTNLTRQVSVELPPDLNAATIFSRIIRDHPAAFSAFIDRGHSTVVSASPERFFRIADGRITASPIKGTRPRGSDPVEDKRLRDELLASEKDRAENTMIVDLLRNDLGRVCEFGSISVDRLCALETHETLYHLVSTISGSLRRDAKISEILRSLFPCGSITGAPKISTMKIIRELEGVERGLSMGAIGYYLPASFGIGETLEMSVAIRTMTVRDHRAVFNVGGGIVIDSVPADEWEETVTKSKALLNALGISV